MEPSAEATETLRRRVRQQEVVAELGQQALETADLGRLMQDAAAAVADTLDCDYCKVLELLPGGDEVFLRQGVGWREGLVGEATVPTDLDSQAGYTLRTEAPVIVDDLRTEERFSGPDLLLDHDVVSGISVIIGSVQDPWGVLGTHTTERREFTDDDATFVQSVATVLGAAIDRERKEQRLRERERHLERYEAFTDDVLDAVDDVFCILDADGRLQRWNDTLCDVTGYADAEIATMHPTDFIHPDDEAAVAAAMEEGFETGSVRVEARVETSRGTYVPYEFAGRTLADPEGEPKAACIGRDVSDRKERSRELARHERIFETFNDGIYVVDPEGQYTMVNEAFAELTGYDREELLGEHATLVVDESTLERAAELRAEMAGDESANPTLETAMLTADGEAVPVEVTFASLPSDEGRLRVGVVRDVTERKRRERQLEESERRYRTLAEHFPNGAVAVYDRDLRYTLAEGIALGDGLPAAESLESNRMPEIFPADTVADLEPVFRAAVEDGETDSVTAEFGGGVWRVWATPLRGADGEIFAGLSFAQDITEQVEREAELERALDLLDKTERIADVGGWEIDAETMDVFWTDHIFDLLEIEADEEPPLDEALDMYDDEDAVVVEEAVERALGGGESFDVEVRIRTAGGDVRWLRLQGVPETEDGDVVTVRGAAQDVTERVRRERRLEELVGRLEESNERLEQFAYAASHDLQEPLRMVSSYLQLIESRYTDALDEDGREFIDYAVDGADRMRDMIEGLLEYSRVETQGEAFEPVDLDDVLDDVRENLQVKVDETDADLAVGSLPRVRGDERQLRQLFQNLLSNAIEYSGDEPPRVRVSAERREGRSASERSGSAAENESRTWTVSVEDDGIGIDELDQERIFEVFQRVHGNDEYAGTGIGLALCERIVERHGGEIRVESEPGEGATFSFELPAAAAE